MKNLMEKHLGYWLRHISNHVSLAFAKRLLVFNVSVGEWVVLNLLSEHKMLPSTAIVAMTGMTPGAVSKLMDKLYQKELVSRVESKTDRRYQEIRLTLVGKKLLPKLVEQAEANEKAFFEHLSIHDKHQIINQLRKISLVNKWEGIPIE